MGDLLDDLPDVGPLTLQDGDKEYFIHFPKKHEVEIKKMDGSHLLTTYHLKYMNKQITCDCPAGRRGLKCKHKIWVSVFYQK